MEGNKSNQEMHGLCKEGCGFYGSSTNEGFCSQCYKKRMRRWLQMNEPSTPTTTNSSSNTPPIMNPPTRTPSPILNVQSSTTNIFPTITTTPTTTAIPTTRAIISSSVDRVEFSGACSDEEIIIDHNNQEIDKSHKKDNTEKQENNKQTDASKPSESHSVSHYNTNHGKLKKAEGSKSTEITDKASISEDLKDSKQDSIAVKEARGEDGDEDKELANVLTTVVEDLEEEKKGKKRNRCFSCNKKVGLTGFGCRCGGVFCGQHRYSDTHQCSFDYKTLGKNEVLKNNPKVAFEKVSKI